MHETRYYVTTLRFLGYEYRVYQSWVGDRHDFTYYPSDPATPVEVSTALQATVHDILTGLLTRATNLEAEQRTFQQELDARGPRRDS